MIFEGSDMPLGIRDVFVSGGCVEVYAYGGQPITECFKLLVKESVF